MSDEKYIEGIKSTGYGLEFSVSTSLIKEGWTVINNKYYIDDVQGSAREIDILAYKATTKNGIQIYTVLIISCKKSRENTWALLAKEQNNNDPNIDWNPVTLWSNHKILKLVIENYDWKDNYINSSPMLYNQLFSPKKHIFAFQELRRTKGTPQNDKAIFNSIISCMKSQGYEIESLYMRKKQESIYNFNLISVVDAPLIRINYGDGEPGIEDINTDIYVGSYIINRKETVSRVHFVKSDSFESCLSIYNELHLHNIKQSSDIFESYFIDALKEKRKIDLFIDKLILELKWDIYKITRGFGSNKSSSVKDFGISWDEKKNCAAITVDGVYEEAELNTLNTNDKLKAKVEVALKKVYRYEGEFYFDSDFPF